MGYQDLSQFADTDTKPSVAQNPYTPISAVGEFLHCPNQACIMTVNLGEGEQAFISSQLALSTQYNPLNASCR